MGDAITLSGAMWLSRVSILGSDTDTHFQVLLFVSPVYQQLLACGKIGMAKHSHKDISLKEQTRREEEKTKPQTQERRCTCKQRRRWG